MHWYHEHRANKPSPLLQAPARSHRGVVHHQRRQLVHRSSRLGGLGSRRRAGRRRALAPQLRLQSLQKSLLLLCWGHMMVVGRGVLLRCRCRWRRRQQRARRGCAQAHACSPLKRW